MHASGSNWLHAGILGLNMADAAFTPTRMQTACKPSNSPSQLQPPVTSVVCRIYLLESCETQTKKRALLHAYSIGAVFFCISLPNRQRERDADAFPPTTSPNPYACPFISAPAVREAEDIHRTALRNRRSAAY
ncbi:hypothetical protein C8R45DRAFT_1104656 [Mycena sanguinolenta]|nr:hypothetical protein C8R45DRAFT_1104656 [Mycena sanguinolenta]